MYFFSNLRCDTTGEGVSVCEDIGKSFVAEAAWFAIGWFSVVTAGGVFCIISTHFVAVCWLPKNIATQVLFPPPVVAEPIISTNVFSILELIATHGHYRQPTNHYQQPKNDYRNKFFFLESLLQQKNDYRNRRFFRFLEFLTYSLRYRYTHYMFNIALTRPRTF